MALTADRVTTRAGMQHVDSPVAAPIAANAVIYMGAAVCRNAAGYAVPASTSATLKTLGVAQRGPYNNTGGANGAFDVELEQGDFFFTNGAADPVTIADIGNDVYWIDDNTIARTNGGSTRSVAGKLIRIDTLETGYTALVRVGVGH